MLSAVLVPALLGQRIAAQGASHNVSPALAGDWQGVLAAGGSQLHLVLHITGTNSALAATLDSIDQGARGIPVSSTTFAAGTLTATIAAAHASYSGTLSADGNTLAGSWTQGQSLPLDFTRVTAATPLARAPARPQTPVKPYPYASIDLTYTNAVQHDTLAATLTVPPGKGPFPAVLLITGSGPQDRDETIADHKPFLVLADYLTRRGVIVLRADDRGTGRSTGDFAGATTADFATDVEAGLALLRSRPEVDARRIGLIGHSEGGIIAPMVAAHDPAVAFLVLLAGTGVPGAEIVADQVRDIAGASGAPAEQADGAYGQEKALLKLIVADTTIEGSTAVSRDPAKLDEALRSQLQQRGVPAGNVDAAVRQMKSPWYRYFLSYDPAPALRQVRCPVLAIDGSKDLQVDAKRNLAAIRAALAAGGNAQVEVQELPGLNHLLQTATTGLPSEYATIPETMSPAALGLIGEFIRRQAAR